MVNGFAPETCVADKGYDAAPVYEACEAVASGPSCRCGLTPQVTVDVG